ncbi:MAG TPA: 16S rRNA (adenine(1518)-N(6)/adenine(1519)-N(6))-dimethyltransferase RsmA [Candidatus Limnocylindrales bacterium]|nr:16S rRNA (adenine(1518)-N(6)/adenine(1519)-N(6))-dimethyltransferase RsmA [Candidatus Limnocylindrales bacterium]
MSKNPPPKKSLGQHWLDDPVSLEAMLLSAEVGAQDTVLEIGPGLGTLTRLLVKRAQHVTAVEFDSDLARDLQKRVSAPNLHVVEQDILQFDLTAMLPGYKVVANIPYYLTSKLVRVLSESSNPPAVAVLLVQKEVAERIAAKPGNLSILGVTSQYFWDVSLGPTVPAALFTPPPKVDSQIVIMQYRAEPLFADIDTKLFFRVVKAGFGEKRKTILNSLSSGLHVDKPNVLRHLEKAQLDPRLRAQNITLEQWYALYTSLLPDLTQ